MSKDRKFVITLSELKRIKQEATEKAVEELMKRQHDILMATAEDDLYLLTVTGLYARYVMNDTEEELYKFSDVWADVQNDVNAGKLDLKKMEKDLLKIYGLKLKRDENSL